MKRGPLKQTLLMAGIAVATLGTSRLAAAADIVVHRVPAGISIAGNEKWCLRLPQGDHVVYKGVVSFDGAGAGSASFLYPAPNAGGLVAAVLTHAFLVDSEKKSQKERIQASADQVLSPYEAVLGNFDYRDLMRRAVEKTAGGANASLIEGSDELGQEMIVESTPVFSMTQDQKALILDNAIVIHMPGAAPEDVYRNTARVVSTAMDAADPAAFWTADNGEKIKDESARLVAKSFDIAFHDAAAGADPDGVPYRTIRYREGAAEKMERAQVLRDQCDRLLIRTLRGTLMSVPVSRPTALAASAEQCGAESTRSN